MIRKNFSKNKRINNKKVSQNSLERGVLILIYRQNHDTFTILKFVSNFYPFTMLYNIKCMVFSVNLLILYTSLK